MARILKNVLNNNPRDLEKEDLLREINRLRDQLEEAAGSQSSAALRNVQQGYARLQEQLQSFMDSDLAREYHLDEAWESGREKLRRTADEVREHPVQSALLALGIGAALGILLRRR